MNWFKQGEEILAMFLLERDEMTEISTLQENQIKINETLGSKTRSPFGEAGR